MKRGDDEQLVGMRPDSHNWKRSPRERIEAISRNLQRGGIADADAEYLLRIARAAVEWQEQEDHTDWSPQAGKLSDAVDDAAVDDAP